MPPAGKKNSSKSSSSPTFEEALTQLEEMVDTMESGQLPLEKLIANYERGAELINHCEKVLMDARKRLELITLKPKASESTSQNALTKNKDNPSNNNNDDEIRLF